jgi:hypothetical protein
MKKYLLIAVILLAFSLVTAFNFDFIKTTVNSVRLDLFNETPPTSVSVKDDIDVDQKKIYFLYSHPYQKPTVLAETTDGKSFNKYEFPIADVPFIQMDPNVMLLAEHEGVYYRIDSKFRIKKTSIENPLTFTLHTNDLSVKSYNKDITYNKLEIVDKSYNKEYSLELPTYLLTADFDNRFIYIYNDDVDNMKYILHIIDRKTGTTFKKIELSSKAYDVLNLEKVIVLSTEDHLSVISKDTFTIETVEYPSEVFEADQLFNGSSGIFMTYVNDNGEAHLLKYDSSFKVKMNKNLKMSYMGAKMKDNKLYLIDQIEGEEKRGGTFAIFELNSGKRISQFDLPLYKTKVQDFVVQ